MLPLSVKDAQALLAWTRERTASVKTRRDWLVTEVKRLGMGEVEFYWQDWSTKEKVDEYTKMRDEYIKFLDFLALRAEGKVGSSECTVDMVMGFDGYVRWLTKQSKFLRDLDRDTREYERISGG